MKGKKTRRKRNNNSYINEIEKIASIIDECTKRINTARLRDKRIEAITKA